MKERYYAVRKGKETCICTSWFECLKEMEGVPGSFFEEFETREDAENWLKKNDAKEVTKRSAAAYGLTSYNEEKGCCSFVAVFEHQDSLSLLKGRSWDQEAVDLKTIAAEIQYVESVLQNCIEFGIRFLTLFYDYDGIEKWATGEWKTDNPYIQKYINYIQGRMRSVLITFKKVNSSSDSDVQLVHEILSVILEDMEE